MRIKLINIEQKNKENLEKILLYFSHLKYLTISIIFLKNKYSNLRNWHFKMNFINLLKAISKRKLNLLRKIRRIIWLKLLFLKTLQLLHFKKKMEKSQL